jgi:peptide/nickel transport system permease protein
MAIVIKDPGTEVARGLDARASWRTRASAGMRLLRLYPMGAFGGAISVLLILIAIAPGLFLPLETQNPLRQSVRERLQGPSAAHWLGQDELGRDLYARIIVATRTSMVVGFGVVALQQLLSIMIGTSSAYLGGKFDLLFQRLIDIGIAIPNLIFIVLLVQTLSARLDKVTAGHGDLLAIVLGIGLVLSAGSSRTIRGVALAVSAQTYVEAARATGATGFRVVTRHIVPNVLPIAITSATILVGSAVLIESSLSFLGYGIQPPTPSWGRMLSDGRSQLVRAPHLAIFPGLAIFLTVFSFNMLGDALRDKLDPRLRGSN